MKKDVPAGASPGDHTQTLILRWNGTGWSKVSSPNPSTTGNNLNGVSATSRTNAWAVGHYCIPACGGPSVGVSTLIVHWNGTAWSKVTSPNPGPTINQLSGVSAISGTNAWAVGHYLNSSNTGEALILHWNGTSWSKT